MYETMKKITFLLLCLIPFWAWHNPSPLWLPLRPRKMQGT